MADTVSSIQPNLRFGTSFLDTKYRNRAANGETLMDKRTGEVVLKRKEDGSLIYFDREQMKLSDYITHIRALTRANVKYTYPNQYNSTEEEMNKIFFETFVVDTQDYIPENITYTDYSSGEKFLNNLTQIKSVGNELDNGFTFSKRANGFFIKMMARPRDTALIEFCSSVYNSYFKNRTFSEDRYIQENRKFTDPSYENYEESNAEIEYSINCYDNSGNVNASYIRSAFVRVNDWSIVPFFDLNFNGNEYGYCKITIKSISIPKMKFMPEILSAENKAIYDKLLDDSSVNADADKTNMAITHMYISTFFTQDKYSIVPDRRNCKVINCVGLPAFCDSMRIIENISSGNGVYIAPNEPDPQTLLGISMWAERIRNVYAKGKTEEIDGHVTDINAIETLFGKAESIEGDFSMVDSLGSFFIEIKKYVDYLSINNLLW